MEKKLASMFADFPNGHVAASHFLLEHIPTFFTAEDLGVSDLESLRWYERNHSDYDDNVGLTFLSLGVESEAKERNRLRQKLELMPGQKVLEIGAGTGRDSTGLAVDLGVKGELHLTDVYPEMLLEARGKLLELPNCPRTYFASVDAHRLPYDDQFFDHVFHFGGINTFTNPSLALSEWVRVTKTGGRIVFGDESIPLWLRNGEKMRAISNSNPLFLHEPPLASIPWEARGLSLEYIFGDGFYCISFSVSRSEPGGDIDFQIPGLRGGTLRTRLHGLLEGVSPESKARVLKTAVKERQSVHEILERLIRENL
jgi:ubiquinone/menaquinone biosynthesis C-methylase UbiE